MEEADSIAVILAGGSGTRFWPLSRKDRPKQYLNLFGESSLIQQTVDRILPLIPQDRIFICSAEDQKRLIEEQLPGISHRILEPEGKNTAVALMLSVVELLRQGFTLDTVMIAFPADHYIRHSTRFLDVLARAVSFARESHGLVTLGIPPTSPHTGYGYIETATDPSTHAADAAMKVRRFLEKPDRKTAETIFRQNNIFWNSGIFIWTLSSLSSAFQKWMPEAWNRISHYRGQKELREIYQSLESIPIDIGILEKAPNVFVFPASDIGWSDVGSWDALYQLHRSEDGNVNLGGTVSPIESRGCLVKVDGKKVALVGVEDLIIVECGDTLLIAHRSKDQWVRQAAKTLE